MAEASNPDPSAPVGQAEVPATPVTPVAGGAVDNRLSPPERASMDTLAGTDGAPVRPAQVVVEQDPLLFELSALLQEESARFQQQGSSSMSVALQAAEGMDFLAHFTRGPAGVEVHVRCQNLDLERLRSFWPSLREAMAPRLQVAPLRAPERNDSPAHRPQAGSARRFRRPGWQKSA